MGSHDAEHPLRTKIEQAVVAILDEIQDDVGRRKKFVRAFGHAVAEDPGASRHVATEYATLGLLQQCCHQVISELRTGVASQCEVVSEHWRAVMRDRALYLSIQIQGLFSSYDILRHKQAQKPNTPEQLQAATDSLRAQLTRQSDHLVAQAEKDHTDFLSSLHQHVSVMENRSQLLRSRMQELCNNSQDPARPPVPANAALLTSAAKRLRQEEGKSKEARHLVYQSLERLRKSGAAQETVLGPWQSGRISAASDLVDTLHTALIRLQRRQQAISFCLWKQASTQSRVGRLIRFERLQHLVLQTVSETQCAVLHTFLHHWTHYTHHEIQARQEQDRMATEAVAQSRREAEEARKHRRDAEEQAHAEEVRRATEALVASRKRALSAQKEADEARSRKEAVQQSRKDCDKARKAAEQEARSHRESQESRKAQRDAAARESAQHARKAGSGVEASKKRAEEARKEAEEARNAVEAVSRSRREAEQERARKLAHEKAKERVESAKAREQAKAEASARWAKSKEETEERARARRAEQPFATKENWRPPPPAGSKPGWQDRAKERSQRDYEKKESERWKAHIAEKRRQEFERARAQSQGKSSYTSSSYTKKTPPRKPPSFIPRSKINIPASTNGQFLQLEKKWEAFERQTGMIRLEDVPFPREQNLRRAAADKAEYKKLVLRWHPDKWLQRYQQRIPKSQEAMLMERVTQTFQLLLSVKQTKFSFMHPG